ncbi:MAG: GNAT family N-acetyltransferase [Candidatus Hydrogenedentes bacterium]|nr:GNAT family N-acetyltransferase [Candidatus Hydrogenedentota bacterium]
MNSQLVRTWEDLAQFERDWDQLWKSGGTCGREFYAFSFMRLMALHTSKGRGAPWCIVCREGSDVVGIIPLFLRLQTVSRFRIGMNCVTFFPNELIQRHGFLGNMPAEEAVPALLNHLQAAPFDLAVLTGLAEADAATLFAKLAECAVQCSLLRVNEPRGGQPGTASVDTCAIELPDTFAAYLETRTPRFRTWFRRAERISRTFGNVTVWRHVEGRQALGLEKSLEEMVEWIQEVRPQTWQARQRQWYGNYGPEFWASLIRTAMEHDALDLAFLLADGKPVAYTFRLVSGAYARSCCTGYHGGYSRMSPGLLLMTLLVKHSIEETGLTRIDMGGSRHYQKTQLANCRDSGYEITIYGKSFKARALYVCRKQRGRWHRFPD